MFYLAKVIQLAGFAEVTYALRVGVTGQAGLSEELTLMLFGAAIFYLGRMVERRAAA